MRRPLLLLILLLILASTSSYLIMLRSGGGWSLEIYVDGGRRAVYSLERLRRMAKPLSVEGCGEISAIPLLDLLKSGGVDFDVNIVSSLTPYGSDGYHRTVEDAYLHLSEAYIEVVGDEEIADYGPLRIVIAGLPRKYWVHHLVKVDVRLEEWKLSLLIEGAVKKSWSLEELSEMPRISIALRGEEVEAFPLTALLDEAGVGVENATIRALSIYGESLEFGSEALPQLYVVMVEGSSISEFGPLLLVSSSGPSLDHLVALEVSG